MRFLAKYYSVKINFNYSRGLIKLDILWNTKELDNEYYGN